jgi:hypothetical protein
MQPGAAGQNHPFAMAKINENGVKNANGSPQNFNAAQSPQGAETAQNTQTGAPQDAPPPRPRLTKKRAAELEREADAPAPPPRAKEPDPATFAAFRDSYETKFAALRERAKNAVTYPPAIIAHENGTPLMEARRFGLIKGKTGAFKSNAAELIFAGLLLSDGTGADFLGFQVPTDAPPVYVGYIDTERDEETDITALWQRIEKLSDKDKFPTRFFPLSLMGETPTVDEILHLVAYMREQADANGHRDARLLVVVDVLSDFADGGNINDQESARAFAKTLEQIAISYDAAFVGILHENHRDDKAAGWLGTVWAQKCSWILTTSVLTDKAGNQVGGKVEHTKVRRGKRPPSAYFDKDAATGRLYLLSSKDARERQRLGKDGDGDGPDLVTEFLEARFSQRHEWTKPELEKAGERESPKISPWQLRDAEKKGPFVDASGRPFTLKKTDAHGRNPARFTAVFGPDLSENAQTFDF